ncbi:hypothetical protein FB451DRAFT_1556994, partial [Mycena latifolia]
MSSTGLLAIQELIDGCISFLDRCADLKSCALVSRAWVYAAQVNLFRVVDLTSHSSSANDHLWSLLRTTLDGSPGFIQHIRRLNISSQLSDDTLSGICQFPFTNVEHVVVFHFRTLRIPDALAMQQLFSLPTLRRVRFHCESLHRSLAVFMSIWDRGSSSIRHLHLEAVNRSHERFDTVSPRSSHPILLESLHADKVSQWLTHDACSLEFSRLRFLALAFDVDLLRAPKFVPAFRTLEVLDLLLNSYQGPIDLSRFLSLTIIRITHTHPDPLSTILRILSTIAPTNNINKIRIEATVPEDEFGQLDEALAGLPLDPAPIIELEMDPVEYESAVIALPLLNARDMLRRADRDRRWFQTFTG